MLLLALLRRIRRAARQLALLPRQVGAHELYIQDLHARLARLENPPPAAEVEPVAQAPPVPDVPVLQTAWGPVPLPPEPLRFRVHGYRDVESYIRNGKQCAHDIEAALATLGHEVGTFRDILDFGCGCGRTLVHLVPRWPGPHFHGTDIDAEAIDWCRANLPLVTVTVNDPLPPTPYEAGRFGLIYAISVFTHLNEDFQFQWLAELRRITAPQGIVLISLHGESCLELGNAQPEVFAELRRAGFLFTSSSAWQGIFPEWYQTAFHTEDYVRQHFARYFDVTGYVTQGVNNHQDMVILRKA